MNAFGSAEWATVVVITVITHALRIKFLVNMRTLVNHVLFAVFVFAGFPRFLIFLRSLCVGDSVILPIILSRRTGVVGLDFLAHLLTVGLRFLRSIFTCLRLETRELLSDGGDVLEENLEHIFLNQFVTRV